MSDFSSSKQPMANIDSSGKIWNTLRRSRRYLFLIMFSFKVKKAFRSNLWYFFLVFRCRKFAARRSIHEIPKASEKVSLHLRLGNFAGSMHHRNIFVLHRKPGTKTFWFLLTASSHQHKRRFQFKTRSADWERSQYCHHGSFYWVSALLMLTGTS